MSDSPDPKFAPVVDAFAKEKNISSGVMMSSFGLKVNQKIFAMHWRGQLVVKLPKPRVDELVATKKGTHFDAGKGRPMKEWIVIPSGKADWIALAKEAHRFVKSGGKS